MKRSFQEEACRLFLQYPALDEAAREKGFNKLASFFLSRLMDRARRTGCPYTGSKDDLRVAMALSAAAVCLDVEIAGEGARAFARWCLDGICDNFSNLYSGPDFFSQGGGRAVLAPRMEEASPTPPSGELPRGRYFLRWFPFPHIKCVPLVGQPGVDFTVMRKGVEAFGEDRLIASMASPLHLFFACGLIPWLFRGGLMTSPFRRKSSEHLCRSFFDKKDKKTKVFLSFGIGKHVPDINEVIALLKGGERVLSRWESLGAVPGKNIFLRPGPVISLGQMDSPLRKMLDEDLLVWHDVLVCILTGRESMSPAVKQRPEVFVSGRKRKCPT